MDCPTRSPLRPMTQFGGALPAQREERDLAGERPLPHSSHLLPCPLRQDSTPFGTLPFVMGRLPGFIGRVDPPPLVMRGWERRRRFNYSPPSPKVRGTVTSFFPMHLNSKNAPFFGLTRSTSPSCNPSTAHDFFQCRHSGIVIGFVSHFRDDLLVADDPILVNDPN